MTKIEKLTQDLRKYLYATTDEISSMDKIAFQKSLYSLMRECIKERDFEIEVGSYIIDINPDDISVTYDNDETLITVTEDYMAYETSRETEVNYYVIKRSSLESSEFSPESPVIRITGIVDNIEGLTKESYNIELFNLDENVMNYVNIPSNMQLSPYTEPTKYSIIVTRPITRTEKRFNVYNLLNPEKVIPVVYDDIKDLYLKTSPEKEYNPADYTQLLPTLDNRKQIVNYIYSLIVEFYTDYIKNNM